MSDPYFPTSYSIVVKRGSADTKWWLRRHDEGTDKYVWTRHYHRAHIFSSKSVCQDYITKYLKSHNASVDERVIDPFAYMGGYGG